MADTVREIERKYDITDGQELPDLTQVPGVDSVVDKGACSLDATYYDTADERLAAAGITLRRRTGGDDAGWHLKLPVGPGVRDEIREPLSGSPGEPQDVPRTLAALVRSRVRGAALLPLVRLRSERDVRHLLGPDGRLLAEVTVDGVVAERLRGDAEGAVTVRWAEVEVELAQGADPRTGLLDDIEARLRSAGLRPSAASSKLARALAETRPAASSGTRKAKASREAKATAGTHVLDYVRAQADALVALDPAVRRDQHDSVHRMRVATRRLRSVFASYRKVLDRSATDPVRAELSWLAGELGIDRDREVLTGRLYERLDELPRALVEGPVRTRLRTWSAARRSGSRRHLLAVLDGRRYLALLDTLDALPADPPLRPDAARPPGEVHREAVLRDYDRFAVLAERALVASPGAERDLAVHDARKSAKRVRYAAEAAVPALGPSARHLVHRMRAMQEVLGDHQDSVVAREALRGIAAQAHAAGESTFTFGVMYGHEAGRAAACERALPELWDGISGGSASRRPEL